MENALFHVVDFSRETGQVLAPHLAQTSRCTLWRRRVVCVCVCVCVLGVERALGKMPEPTMVKSAGIFGRWDPREGRVWARTP
jgi:hypothetical protein